MKRTRQVDLFELPDDSPAVEPLDGWYVGRGFRSIAGVDEAGRGALAGPVCAAAVILGDESIEGLDDSKKLAPEVREALYDEIWGKARGVGVGMVGPAMIDGSNILRAALEAMRLAVWMLPEAPDLILVDGDRVPAGLEQAVAVVKGDTRLRCVMAASIVAKVTRDRYMRRAGREFPEFGFEGHKGYAVRAHFEALERHGLTPIHRRTFAPCAEAAGGLPDAGRAGTIALRAARERSE